jgi:hypothetical protein
LLVLAQPAARPLNLEEADTAVGMKDLEVGPASPRAHPGEAARREYLPKRTGADFQAWRDQQAWTAEKYRRFARDERTPADWRRLLPA